MVDIINLGSPSDRNSIELVTKKRRRIPNVQRRPLLPDAMVDAQRMVLAEHPTWRIRSAASEYNCMGMVFASRRTNIEPEHFPLIAEDDGLWRLRQVADVMVGDIALYRGKGVAAVAHVGLVVAIRKDVGTAQFFIEVLSQIGAHGEFFHQSHEFPIGMTVGMGGGLEVEFWTERKETNEQK